MADLSTPTTRNGVVLEKLVQIASHCGIPKSYRRDNSRKIVVACCR